MKRLLFALVVVAMSTQVFAQVPTTTTICDGNLFPCAPYGPSHPFPTSQTGAYTYSAAIDVYTGYATPTDIVSISGSSTKTIEITDIRVSGYATANDVIQIDLLKRSTADTGGTPTTITNVPLNSTNPAPTATVVSYAAAPTLGNLVGNLCACQVELPAKAGVGGYILEWPFNSRGETPIILHGANEQVALNLLSTTLPSGGTLNVTIHWIEQ